MEEICVVSERKYLAISNAAVVLSIITALLLALYTFVIGSFVLATKIDMPEDGLWHCEELDLELEFSLRCETYRIIQWNGEQCLLEIRRHNDTISIYKINNVIPAEDEEMDDYTGVQVGQYIYEEGEQICRLTVTKQKKDYFKVRGRDGSVYVFARR